MSPAVITFDFDPVLRLGSVALRLETVALAGAILAGLIVAAVIAGRTPAGGSDPGRFVHGPRLRRDDLLFIVLGVVPGALIGGRLGYAALHADYYLAEPAALLDPSRGSIELSAAVAGGALAGAYVARLLDGSVGRWLHVAALPMLVVVGLGKVAAALGGAGQGLPSALPWATAYAGPGPWGSLAPAVPAHPSQLYEALVVAAAAAIVLGLGAAGRFARRDGTAFFVALAGWCLGRFAVGVTWRDEPVLGVVHAGQVLALAVAGAALGLAAVIGRRESRRADARAAPSWPDPATRPRF